MTQTFQSFSDPLFIGLVAALLVSLTSFLKIHTDLAKVKRDRAATKSLRDDETMKVRDDVMKLQFKVSSLEGRSVHHEELIFDLKEQVSILNKNLAVLTTEIGHLIEAVQELKSTKT